MTFLARILRRNKCYVLGLAAWITGFVYLSVVHHCVSDSTEVRNKHAVGNVDVHLVSPVAIAQVNSQDNINLAVNSTELREAHIKSKLHQTFKILPAVLQQNNVSDRFIQLTGIHRKRIINIRDVCSKQHGELSSNKRTPLGPRPELSTLTLRHIYVSDKHKFMYCFVPKVGCSNWKRVMMFLKNHRRKIYDISSREAHSRNHLKTLRNYKPEERHWRLKCYKKFMFVRNPVSRIVSVYRNKFEDLGVFRKAPEEIVKYGKHIVKSYRPNATLRETLSGENVTWAEWIDYLTNRDEEAGFSDHWMQMSKLCSPCSVGYDYIGKLENVKEDANFILKVLNLTDIVGRFPGPENSHPTNTSLGEARSYFDDISSRKRSTLWEMYKLDFQMFGYNKPNFFE